MINNVLILHNEIVLFPDRAATSYHRVADDPGTEGSGRAGVRSVSLSRMSVLLG